MPIGQRPVWKTPSNSSTAVHMLTTQNATVAMTSQKQ